MHIKSLINFTAYLLFMFAPTSVFSQSLESAYAAANEGDFQTSLSIATPLAQKGDAEAQLLLGMHYMMGLGVTANPSVGVEWYTKAANQDNANALALMGNIYLDGVHASKDVEKATRFLTKAGQLGNYKAFDVLGVMYEDAKGVNQDFVRSLMWYEISIAYGGDETFKSNLVEKMSDQEIQEAVEMAQSCIDSGFLNCNSKNSKSLSELFCALTNVQGGVLGQNDSWPQLGENYWNKISLGRAIPVKASGQETIGPGMLLMYQTVTVDNDEAISANLYLDVSVPGFDLINSINKYSQNNLRLQYRCFDKRLSFIKNVVGEY